MSREDFLRTQYSQWGTIEPDLIAAGERDADDLDRAIFDKWWEAWVKKEGIEQALNEKGIEALSRSIAWAGFKLGWNVGCEECQ